MSTKLGERKDAGNDVWVVDQKADLPSNGAPLQSGATGKSSKARRETMRGEKVYRGLAYDHGKTPVSNNASRPEGLRPPSVVCVGFSQEHVR